MSYLVMVSSGASAVGREFDPPISIRLKTKIDRGLELTDEEQAGVPRVLRVAQRKGGGIPAILGWLAGPFIVCESLKDKLESLEPGRHRFLPLEIWGLENSHRDQCYGIYYWIVSPPRLDAVIVEETTFAKGYGRTGYELSGGQISSAADGVCVLDGNIVAGHHFWQLPSDFGATKQYPEHSSNEFFCSDALRDFVASERMGGWNFAKKCIKKKE